jgi:hypothetical protein
MVAQDMAGGGQVVVVDAAGSGVVGVEPDEISFEQSYIFFWPGRGWLGLRVIGGEFGLTAVFQDSRIPFGG